MKLDKMVDQFQVTISVFCFAGEFIVELAFLPYAILGDLESP